MKQYPFFVYGSLKRGFHNHHYIERAATRIESGTTHGKLYSLGSFPMMVPGQGEVAGEVVTIATSAYGQVLRQLDRLEGYRPHDHQSSFYTRQLVRVRVDGRIVRAWAYVGRDRQVAALPFIPDGNWQLA